MHRHTNVYTDIPCAGCARRGDSFVCAVVVIC